MARLIAKNWAEFQHYKDRSPSWIKLHKRLIDDFEFQCLPVASRALAPMLWLLASEEEDGSIDYSAKKLAFRLRTTVEDIEQAVKPLIDSGFFEYVPDCNSNGSSLLAQCLPREEKEKEKEKEKEEEIEKEVAQPLALREPEKVKDETALQTACKQTWESYCLAYQIRYKVAPVRNAKVNAQVKQLCKSLPLDEAPQVAEFYVFHNQEFYVRKGHDFGLLVSDASKLRTEWATGQMMTGTRAKQMDRTSSMLDAAEQVKREMGWA